jgi:hypothetical protein
MLVESLPLSPIENSKLAANTMLPATAVAINFHSGQSRSLPAGVAPRNLQTCTAANCRIAAMFGKAMPVGVGEFAKNCGRELSEDGRLIATE